MHIVMSVRVASVLRCYNDAMTFCFILFLTTLGHQLDRRRVYLKSLFIFVFSVTCFVTSTLKVRFTNNTLRSYEEREGKSTNSIP